MRNPARGSGIDPEPVPTVLLPVRIPAGTLPARLPGGRLPARIRVPEPHRPSRMRYLPVVLACVAGAALAVGAVVAVVSFVMWVASLVAWVIAHLVVIGAVLAALVLLGCLRGRSSCQGIHCSGCRR